MKNPIILLGVPFHYVTLSETMDLIAQWVKRRKPSFLATANLDFATQAARDVELQEILLQADLVVCDGMPLVWASKWLGAVLPERVAGSDMVWSVFERGDQEKWRVYFLGANQDTLVKVQDLVAREYPGVIVSGAHAPPYGSIHDLDNEAIVSNIKAASPDLLLVAMGCPKQEKWICMNYREMGVPVSMGIGASLDFVAGKFKRAPFWMQVSGLEWLYRILQEPKRMVKRYGINFFFLLVALYRQKRSLNQLKVSSKEVVSQEKEVRTPELDFPCLALPQRVSAVELEQNIVPELKVSPSQPNGMYSCSDVQFIDSTGLGFLTRMHKKCAEVGGALVIYRPSEVLQKLLESVNLNRVLYIAKTLEDVRVLCSSQASSEASSFVSDQTVIFTVESNLRAAGVTDVFEKIEKAWADQPEAKELKLDLSQVRFMDSTGLSLLIRSYKLARGRAGSCFALLHADENVKNIIHISNLDSIFSIENKGSAV